LDYKGISTGLMVNILHFGNEMQIIRKPKRKPARECKKDLIEICSFFYLKTLNPRKSTTIKMKKWKTYDIDEADNY